VSDDVARWANPVRLVFGPGATTELDRECGALGRRAMIVTDERLAAGEHVTRVRERLAATGSAVTTFAGVRANPDLATVRAAAAAAREVGAEVVVGLGGGSCLDVAKAVAAARVPGLLDAPEWTATAGLVAPQPPAGPPALPLVQVPTTHATGSELNPVASLVDDRGDKRLLLSPLLYARVAVVDPALHVSVPAHQTAEGSLESICRVLIPYLTDRADRALPDAQAQAIVAVLLDATPRAMAAADDLRARGDLALATAASVQGLAGLGRSRHGHVLWYLGNALALGAGATKGQTLAPLLGAHLELLAAGDGPAALGRPERLARLGAAVLRAPHDAQAARRSLRERLAGWGLPEGLAQLGVRDGHVQALVAQTRRLWDGDALAGLDDRTLERIYRAAL